MSLYQYRGVQLAYCQVLVLQIHAEKSPFLTERLRVFILPTLALIKHEKTTDYVAGFDELGGTDDFPTDRLAQRLAHAGLIFENDAAEYGGAPKSKPQGMPSLYSVAQVCVLYPSWASTTL